MIVGYTGGRLLRKSTLTKVGLVLFLLLLFIGYNVYLKWEKTHFTVDAEAFNVKDSLDQVMEEEYKWIEGLQLADQFNKLKNVDISRELPNQQRDISLHKTWFLPGGFFVLYSINLQKGDENPQDIPELNYSKVTMKSSDGETKTFQTLQNNDIRETIRDDDYEGEVLDKRLYRSLLLVIDPERIQDDDTQDLEHFFENMNKIMLHEATLNYHENNENNSDDSGKLIDNLAVSMDFNFEDYEYATIPIHQEILLDNGRKLQFGDLDVSAYQNTLYFAMEENNASLKNMEANIVWDGREGEEYPSTYDITKEDGDYSAWFRPFVKIPSQLKVSIQSISYAIDKDVSFDIPANTEETESSEPIGEVEGIHFYFDGYETLDDHIGKDLVGLKVTWEPTDTKMLPLPSFDNLVLQHDLEQQLKRFEKENGIEWTGPNARNILVVKNEKGEKPEYHDPFDKPDTPNTRSGQESVTIFLEKAFVEQSEKLEVIIRNFTYDEELQEEPFHLKIPSEYVSNE